MKESGERALRNRKSSPRSPKISSKLKKIIKIVLDKGCHDVVVLDLRKFRHVCDFFVICTSDSSVQTEAVIHEIKRDSKASKRGGLTIKNVDFNPTASWNVVDFGDIMLHIFDSKSRSFYDLEGLWADARTLCVRENGSIAEEKTERLR